MYLDIINVTVNMYKKIVCIVVWIQPQAYLHFDYFDFVTFNCTTIPNCIEYTKISILLFICLVGLPNSIF